MANSVYQVNKGINKSIEFKGLKAQYIWYLGGGIVTLLIAFAVMYIAGLPSLLCIGIILIAGTTLVMKIYGMSKKYGEYGLMKKIAQKSIPQKIKNNTRTSFINFLKK